MCPFLSELLTEIKNHRGWKDSLYLLLYYLFCSVPQEKHAGQEQLKMCSAWSEGVIIPLSQCNRTTVRIAWRLATLRTHSLTSTEYMFMMDRTSVTDGCKGDKKSISLSEWTFNCRDSGGHEYRVWPRVCWLYSCHVVLWGVEWLPFLCQKRHTCPSGIPP